MGGDRHLRSAWRAARRAVGPFSGPHLLPLETELPEQGLLRGNQKVRVRNQTTS